MLGLDAPYAVWRILTLTKKLQLWTKTLFKHSPRAEEQEKPYPTINPTIWQVGPRMKIVPGVRQQWGGSICVKGANQRSGMGPGCAGLSPTPRRKTRLALDSGDKVSFRSRGCGGTMWPHDSSFSGASFHPGWGLFFFSLFKQPFQFCCSFTTHVYTPRSSRLSVWQSGGKQTQNVRRLFIFTPHTVTQRSYESTQTRHQLILEMVFRPPTDMKRKPVKVSLVNTNRTQIQRTCWAPAWTELKVI